MKRKYTHLWDSLPIKTRTSQGLSCQDVGFSGILKSGKGEIRILSFVSIRAFYIMFR